MGGENARLHDLCCHAADLAADFPRGEPVDVDPDADIGVAMTAYWNIALARAAGLLARTIIDMCTRRTTETIVKAGRKLEHWPLEKSSTRGRC